MIRQDLESPTLRPGAEPVIGNLSPTELAEERSGPWLGREAEGPSPIPPPPPRPDAETEERLLAQALGALIREGGATRPPAATSTGSGTDAGWPLAASHCRRWRRRAPPTPGGMNLPARTSRAPAAPG